VEKGDPGILLIMAQGELRETRKDFHSELSRIAEITKGRKVEVSLNLIWKSFGT
jgi:hypothetical protein